jgi:hypothetical protein
MSDPVTPATTPAETSETSETPETARTPATASATATALVPDPALLARKADRPLDRKVQVEFIEELVRWGNVRAAAQRIGVSRANLYRMRRACETFRLLWDAALVLARPRVEEVLADRALNGVSESVFYHGEEVATRTRHDARLLLAHLGRLDRLENTFKVQRTLGDFEAELALLRRLRPVRLAPLPPGDDPAD